MPAKYMNAFSFGRKLRTVQHVFAWSNDPGEDADLASYISIPGNLVSGANQEVRNAMVDRSGSAPVLSWETWYLSGGTWHLGGSGSLTLSTGSAIYLAFNLAVTEFDPTGYWDSDEYGRPLDLNDLLA